MKKVIIMGAAGRDFHNFNTFFRDNPDYRVVAFTATQIPNIEGRLYPPSLAGKLYPDGIPIIPEEELEKKIKEEKVDIVVFSYSDVSFEYVMERGSRAMASGADFWLLGPESTWLESRKPVIAVCAVRTGAGKSQTSRKIARILKEHGKKVAVVRHPMPYGDLEKQRVQRFESYEDMDRYQCTFEEREEYEPHIKMGNTVFAGVDYQDILREAERDFDIVIWEGGNNDLPFYKPDILFVVVDPLRPGHELRYHPGATLFRMADVIVINKIDSAREEDLKVVESNIEKYANPQYVVKANSPIFVENGDMIRGKKVLAIEDGPTLTHGEMSFGAAMKAAQVYGAEELSDPTPYAIGSIKEAFQKYPHVKNFLPCLGYGEKQMKELEEVINNTPADLVIIGTPVDISKKLKINKPFVRVTYELEEIGSPTLEEILRDKGII